MVRFGDPPNAQNNDPLLRSVFGGNAMPPGDLGGQTDYVYDFLDNILWPIIPSKDQFGGNKQEGLEGGFIPGDDQLDAVAGGYVCVTEPNDPEDQPPDESCWCVWMREDSIAQQGLGPIFKTREACVANCHCNDEDPNPPYPDPPEEPPISPPITNMCLETSAMKVLKMQVRYRVFRDSSRDLDPNTTARYKYYKYGIEVEKRTWRKASLRDCVYINSPEYAGISRRRSRQQLKVAAYPSYKQLLQEGGQGEIFYDTYTDSIDIAYDVEWLFRVGPSNCNIGCIDFESTDDTVFYDFCGGGTVDRDDGRLWAGGLYVEEDDDARYIAWKQGMVNRYFHNGSFLGAQIYPLNYGPYAENQIDHLQRNTAKESILIQTLFNLNPARYGTNTWLQKQFALGGSAAWILNPLRNISVDYCIGENNEIPSIYTNAASTLSKNNTKIIGDDIILDPQLNYLYKFFNTLMYWSDYFGDMAYDLADTYPYT